MCTEFCERRCLENGNLDDGEVEKMDLRQISCRSVKWLEFFQDHVQ
jgi:hypothetical protein